MRALVQRVTDARVRIDGSVVGEIGTGLCVLVGVTHDDDEAVARKLADKVWNLRVFPDDAGTMNLPVSDAGGAVLVVSQFTLYGEHRARPSPLVGRRGASGTGRAVGGRVHERSPRARRHGRDGRVRRRHAGRAGQRRARDADARGHSLSVSVRGAERRVKPSPVNHLWASLLERLIGGAAQEFEDLVARQRGALRHCGLERVVAETLPQPSESAFQVVAAPLVEGGEQHA